MTKEEILRIWAPASSIWSPWVKPVLFSFMDGVFPPGQPRTSAIDLHWLPADQRTALILNLPREDSVLWSIELARRGYRPVPLYNALPFPLDTKMSPRSRPVSTVIVEPILAALREQAAALQDIPLRKNAPPAFLLDADRDIAGTDPVPGVFENRSVCFSTDFPSAEFMIANDITHAILVEGEPEITGDLHDALFMWQTGGIQLCKKRPYEKGAPVAFTLKQRSSFRKAWDRLRVIFGLRQARLGAFGGLISTASG